MMDMAQIFVIEDNNYLSYKANMEYIQIRFIQACKIIIG